MRENLLSRQLSDHVSYSTPATTKRQRGGDKGGNAARLNHEQGGPPGHLLFSGHLLPCLTISGRSRFYEANTPEDLNPITGDKEEAEARPLTSVRASGGHPRDPRSQ